MDSINGLNEMNMDDLAMDEYLRSLDEKRDDEYSFIFNTHPRLMFLQSRLECTRLPTKNETAKTNENSWNMTIPSLNLNIVFNCFLAKKETRLQLQGIMNLNDQININLIQSSWSLVLCGEPWLITWIHWNTYRASHITLDYL